MCYLGARETQIKMFTTMKLLLLSMLLALATTTTSVNGLGVNWGTNAFNQLAPWDVVELLELNNITKVKLFEADFNIVRAMVGKGIEVMVAAPNDKLATLATDNKATTDWVKQNVIQFLFKGGVDIKWVAVGNEPFLSAYNNTYLNTTYPALRNIQAALEKSGHTEVRAIVPFNADVLTSAPVPSQTRFKPEYMSQITPMLQLFNRTGAPFSVNLYPYISLYQNADFPLDYAFFNGTSSPLVDGSITYQNALDASLDGLVHALTAAGYPNMPIMLGEIGWPTDGAKYATIEYAGRYMQQMITHLQSNVGTPLRPNTTPEFYLFGLLDENKKSTLPGPFERSWGMFYYDGIPKYSLNLNSPHSPSTELGSLPNPPYMPARWCIVDSAAKDKTNLTQNVEWACDHADCTALNPGSSCSGLTQELKDSYAFNSYYQAEAQHPDACYFEGLATLSKTNPSTGKCRFALSLQPTKSGGENKSSLNNFFEVIGAVFVVALFVALIISS